ncbi:putative cro protein [Xanthomonas phage FoX4]|uniref:Putative cro protein n=1 Tax=Xanthomonas phage FoX4 TaxID=2723900 RepID=A0A858WNX9_9CAUD|nr:putative cro protein [Xanthomonas phage FoX4]QJI52958.1 putative cro protein [Xanthomonas phage FoX4]
MKYPKWVTFAPKKQQPSLRILYHFRVAALHSNPEGSIPSVAQQIGYAPSSIQLAIRRGQLSRGMAACMEKHFDQDVFPTIIMAREGLIK